jgi:hypothetical protein
MTFRGKVGDEQFFVGEVFTLMLDGPTEVLGMPQTAWVVKRAAYYTETALEITSSMGEVIAEGSLTEVRLGAVLTLLKAALQKEPAVLDEEVAVACASATLQTLVCGGEGVESEPELARAVAQLMASKTKKVVLGTFSQLVLDPRRCEASFTCP